MKTELVKTSKTIKEELIKFLKEKRAYRKFIRNMKKGSFKDLDELIEHKVYWCNPISSAFPWCDTPEDHEFWSELNREFNDIVLNLVRKNKVLEEENKVLEEVREKLFSMRATREEIERLDIDDRLIEQGYHDCINDLLIWTKELLKK